MPTETALELIKERGFYCEVEGCNRLGEEAHHCLYRRDKHVKKVLEEKYNFQLVCHECHANGAADSYENRVYFWNKQCERYGKDVMLDWHSRVPYKIKEKAYR